MLLVVVVFIVSVAIVVCDFKLCGQVHACMLKWTYVCVHVCMCAPTHRLSWNTTIRNILGIVLFVGSHLLTKALFFAVAKAVWGTYRVNRRGMCCLTGCVRRFKSGSGGVLLLPGFRSAFIDCMLRVRHGCMSPLLQVPRWCRCVIRDGSLLPRMSAVNCAS
jgi:hypothetical protein